MLDGGEVFEQAERVVVVPGRGRIPAGHEDGGDSGRSQPRHDLAQLGLGMHLASSNVRHDGVPMRAEAFGEFERILQPFGRGCGDRELALGR